MSTELDQMFQNVEPYREDEAPKAVKRDRWGRPVILQEDGKGKPYIRASTLAGALDDKTALGDWKARMTGRGVAISPDLTAGFAAITDMDSKEGKDTANELAEQAQERAGSTTKRTLGTAFHSFSETYDRGQTVEHLPDALKPLLRSYIAKTKHVRWLAFEQFVVIDEIEAAGTADRVGQVKGQLPRIFDIKTGRVDYGQMKFAVQLAVYAHGRLYDPKTGQRKSWPSMDMEIGHVIHADPVTGETELYDVDLDFGWWAAQEARRVYDARKRKDIMTKTAIEQVVEKTTMQRMAAVTTLDELRDLWRETGKTWGDKERQFADKMAAEIKGKMA